MPHGARLSLPTLRVAVVALLGTLALLFVAQTPDIASAAPACTRYAASGGSDSASGSASSPFRTAQRLFDSLAPGEVGCLQPGTTFSERLRANRSGRPGNPVTITSGPGEGRATLLGEIYVPDGATDIVYTNLIINGRTSFRVNPSVNGDRITFSNNEVTDDNHGICFHLGKPGEGVAEDIVIDGNRIHGCGRLPATGFDHGIYLNTTRNVRITNNYIYDNADYGVHLYPDAQGTYVANNVIDGNGRGITFSGEGSTASSNNVVVDNIISNSKDTANVESYWGGPVGSGNRADGNCLWNGAEGNVQNQRGFSVSNNVVADPLFTNRGAKDFSLRAGSPCAGKGPTSVPGGSSGTGGGATTPAASAPALSAPALRALRTLRLSISWLSGDTFVVSARTRLAGRVKIVPRSGSTILGACTRRAARNTAVKCRFSVRRANRALPVVVAASLDPLSKKAKGVRVRLARKVPQASTLSAQATWAAGGPLVLGVRSKVGGEVTMTARHGSQRLGQCRKAVVQGKSVSCRFDVSGVPRGSKVAITAGLKPASGGKSLFIRLSRTLG